MDDPKKELRVRALQLRKAAFDLHGAEASRLLAAYGLDFLKARPGTIVSGFAAIRDEINPAELLAWLHAEGYRLALPVMVGKNQPLVMRSWTPGPHRAQYCRICGWQTVFCWTNSGGARQSSTFAICPQCVVRSI